MDGTEELVLRPHHGLCLLHFVEEGYSDAFTANMAAAAARLRENPETLVRLCIGADSLCAHCPHRTGSTCESAKPARYDTGVLQHSGLKAEQTLRWADLREKMVALSQVHLREVCGDCQWYSLCAAIEEQNNS